jgi:integrase
MGTITSRKKKDGAVSYTAQIRIRRKGEIVYQESGTFARKSVATAWMKKREAELAEPGALDRLNRKSVTIKEVIEHYKREYGAVRPLGKTKRNTLAAIADTWLGALLDKELTSQRLVEYGQWRLTADGGAVLPQTVNNDLAHLGAVVSVAKAAWDYDINPQEMVSARKVMRRMGLVARSAERSRRPSLDELAKLFQHYSDMAKRDRSEIPMLKLIPFALYSTRRQEEICRIRWDDLDKEHNRVLVRDMKNPGQTIGNDVWCSLPDEAIAIIDTMPKDGELIFPFNGKSISSSFTRVTSFLAIDDLHFHDLRHEGVSRLFEMEWDIPRVASVSGHRDWNSLRRYTHLQGRGDKYEGWPWLKSIIG